MFPLDYVPTELLPAIFDKMNKREFLMAPMLSSYTKQIYEASVNRFKQQPLHYLDKLRLPRVSVELSELKEDYANLILKNIQSGSFPLSYFYIAFEEKRPISTAELTKDLQIETLVYDSERDPTALFHNVKPWHVFSSNRHIFTMRNQKNVLFLVTLTTFSLAIDEAPLDKAKLLERLWDGVRNADCYPLPDGTTVDSL